MQSYTLTRESELENVAAEVLAGIKKEHRSGAAVLALHGELGAGKTTFMQVLARVLGVREGVTSPTYVIMKKYSLPEGDFSMLVHIDAYRVEIVDEMQPLRFDEELAQKESIIGIEWAERIAPLLPQNAIHIDFEIQGNDRVITVQHGKES